MQRLLGPEGPLTPAHLLHLATAAGAHALGLADLVGDLSVGKQFDAICVRPRADDPLDIGLRHATSPRTRWARSSPSAATPTSPDVSVAAGSRRCDLGSGHERGPADYEDLEPEELTVVSVTSSRADEVLAALQSSAVPLGDASDPDQDDEYTRATWFTHQLGPDVVAVEYSGYHDPSVATLAALSAVGRRAAVARSNIDAQVRFGCARGRSGAVRRRRVRLRRGTLRVARRAVRPDGRGVGRPRRRGVATTTARLRCSPHWRWRRPSRACALCRRCRATDSRRRGSGPLERQHRLVGRQGQEVDELRSERGLDEQPAGGLPQRERRPGPRPAPARRTPARRAARPRRG